MTEVMFEVQDFKARRFAEHFEQAPVVEFAAQLAERLRLIVATGDRGKWCHLRAHPCLTHPGAHRAARHSHTFNTTPSGPRARKAKVNGLARNPSGGAPSHELALFH